MPSMAYAAGRNHETADLVESDRKGSILDRSYHGITSVVMDEGMPRHGATIALWQQGLASSDTPQHLCSVWPIGEPILLAIRAALKTNDTALALLDPDV